MTDAKDVPTCTCYDDYWQANNAENHEPTCPVIAAFATLTRERDAARKVIEAATKYADFYDGFLATEDVLPIHDAILAAVAALRATTPTEATP
jgi:hypothetical protein